MISRSASTSLYKKQKKFRLSNDITLAEFNKIVARQKFSKYNINRPYRIEIGDSTNTPCFKDLDIDFEYNGEKRNKVRIVNQKNIGLTKWMKDLSFLAEGMKRAKYTKSESKFYFMQGILMHNYKEYKKAIQYFQKNLTMAIQMKDEKALQLILNSIAISYLYEEQYESNLQFILLEALEIHLKQGQVSKANQFVLNINVGHCFQLLKKNNEALSRYQQAFQKMGESKDIHKRKAYLKKLIQRVQSKLLEEQLFLTENNSPKNSFYQRHQRSKSPFLSQSLPKNSSRSLLKFTIEKADETLDSYLDNMRQSIVRQT